MTNYKKLNLGELPVDLINHHLETNLDPGTVILSSRGHQHIAEDHPDDYDVAKYYLSDALKLPNYIGQGPDQGENFEFVFSVQESLPKRELLVAIGLEKDKKGFYRVKTAYLLGKETVDNRLNSGHLKKV